MKKFFKVFGIVLLSLILLMGISGFIGWNYLKSSFLEFEDDYAERTAFDELTEDGFTFFDRNANGKLDIYEDHRRTTEERVADALLQMSIEEKIHLLKGSGIGSAMGRGEPGEGIPGAVGTIVPTPSLGLPTIYLSDGPAGLRIQPTREGEEKTYYCTAFPIATVLASTWNTDLVQQVGGAMGKEALEYGIDVILGPGANIHRHPFCGRNFEYYSEDPLLSGKMGAAMVNGIESHGIGTAVKHFVANNQETNRNFNDTQVSDRAMREIYLKGFEIIVKESQPWTIMSSYNKVNGTWVPESRDLVTDILRDDWGFKGLVMSDWFGGNDAVAMINAGNDLLEPGTKKQWDALVEGYEEGTLPLEHIDTSVRRILKLVFESRKMQGYQFSNNPDLERHAAITRQSAAEGIVLLKNDGALPLTTSDNAALLGSSSYDFIAGGTGSGDVNEAYSISLEEGLRNAGFALNQMASNIYETFREEHIDAFVKPEGMEAMFNPYSPPQIDYIKAQLDQIASDADVALITIGRNAGEGGDRVEKDDFLLSESEQQLITNTCNAFHAVGKKVVVVLNIGGVIETASWNAKPDAILLAWQGGQEGGNSVADIISGQLNPSGKLPMTFPVKVQDHASDQNFPQDGEPMQISDMLFGEETPEEDWIRNRDFTVYEEGIYVGYRHFDKAELQVAYPFGYGLSYTTFEYGDSDVSVKGDTISFSIKVKNKGQVAGKEVAQVYVSKIDSEIDRPRQELKAFAKTELLEPGDSQQLNFQVLASDFSYWNEETSGWELEPGGYEIKIGSSSRDIRSVERIEL